MRPSRAIPLLIVALAVVGEIAIRFEQARSVTAYWAAKRELRAYSVVKQDDLELRTKPRSSLPDRTSDNLASLAGHVLLTHEGAGSAMRTDQVSDNAVDPTRATYITAMSATKVQTLNGKLSSGDTVTLSFNDPHISEATDVLIIDVAQNALGKQPYLIVLGSALAFERSQSAALSRGAVSLTLQP